MKTLTLTAFAMIGTATLLLPEAEAQSLTGNVASAGVTEGERAVEARMGFDDNGNAAARTHFDYAPTGWYQIRLIGSFAKPEDGDWDYRGFTFENWFQWSEEAKDTTGFNGGLRFAYTFRDGAGPDEAAVRLTLTDKFADGWEWRANVIGEIETGDGSDGGVGLEARAQLTRAIEVSALSTQDWRLGFEVFSEFGNTRDIPGFEDQAHQIGAVAKAEWENGVYLQTAIRFGLTDASDDSMLKVFIGREF